MAEIKDEDLKKILNQYNKTYKEKLEAIRETLEEINASDLPTDEAEEAFDNYCKFFKELEKGEEKLSALLKDSADKSKKTVEEIEKKAKELIEIQKKIKDGSATDAEKDQYKEDKKTYKLSEAKLKAINKQLQDNAIAYQNVNKAQKIYNAELREANKVAKKHTQIVERISTVWNGAIKALTPGVNKWLEINEASRTHAKSLGLSQQQATAYQRTLTATAKEVARTYGMEFKEIQKIQEGYAEVTNRATMLSSANTMHIASITKLVGSDAVNKVLENMDNLGGSADAATREIAQVYAQASNMGLNAVKTSSAFAKNMSMANKYTFKDGLNGIRQMTILSQKLKFDLESMGNVIDNFNNIENAISNSAKLQMLGGSATLNFGNPLANLSDAMMNPEALIQRTVDMFRSKGRFDKSTGETKITPYDMMWMREAAKAAGMNPEDAVKIARQSAKNNEIESQLNSNITDENLKALITSKAEYDVDKQKFYITDEYGNQRDVSSITSPNDPLLKQLIAQDKPVENIRENVEALAKGLLSTNDRKRGLQEGLEIAQAQHIDPAMNVFDGMLEKIQEGNGILGNIYNWIVGGGVGTGFYMLGKMLFPMMSTAFMKSYKSGGSIGRSIGKAFGKGTLWGKKTSSLATPQVTATETVVQDSKAVLNKSIKLSGKTNGLTPDKIARGRKIVEAKNAVKSGKLVTTAKTATTSLKGASKLMKGSAIFSVIAGAVDGIVKWNDAVKQTTKNMEELNSQASVRLNFYKNGGDLKAHERIQQQIKDVDSHNKKAAVASGVGTALGGIVGTAIGAFLAPFTGGLSVYAGGAIGGMLGGAIGSTFGDTDYRTGNDLMQEDFETAKFGSHALNGTVEEVKLDAARATIKMHDLLISIWNHMNGKQSNGSIDESRQSWWDKLWNSDSDKQSKTHYVDALYDPTPHAKGGNVGLPSEHPLAQAYQQEQSISGGKARLMVANTNEAVVPIPTIGKIKETVNPIFESLMPHFNAPSSKLDDINLNINGTLKLDATSLGGKTENLDLSRMFNDPKIKSIIIDMVKDEFSRINGKKMKDSPWYKLGNMMQGTGF